MMGVALLTLAVSIRATAGELLSIEPAHALPDYTKTKLVSGTTAVPLWFIYATDDFNEDGRSDLAALVGTPPEFPGAANGIYIYLQSPEGQFTKSAAYLVQVTDRSRTMITVDLNGDNHLDLLENDEDAEDLILLLGNGDGTFQSARYLGLSASYFPIIFHLNDDAIPDLVVGRTNDTVAFFIGAGDGTFTEAFTRVPSPGLGPFRRGGYLNGPGQLLCGDVNGDGSPDVVLVRPTDSATLNGTLDIFLAFGDVGTRTAMFNVAAWRGALGDFNGDGKLDYAGVAYDPNRLEIWLGEGDGSFINGRTFSLSIRPRNVIARDMNEDGVTDVVVDGVTPNGIAWAPLNVFLGNGDGTFQARLSVTPIAGDLARDSRIADVNGDQRPDILMHAQSAIDSTAPSSITVALNQGFKVDPKLGFLLRVQGTVQTRLVIESSSNLSNWTSIKTNLSMPGEWSVVDTNTSSYRFYRTRR
jgi:hypothetical protein